MDMSEMRKKTTKKKTDTHGLVQLTYRQIEWDKTNGKHVLETLIILITISYVSFIWNVYLCYQLGQPKYALKKWRNLYVIKNPEYALKICIFFGEQLRR